MIASTDDTITAGTAAWARIKDTGRKSFNDWIDVARALAIGRCKAMKMAKANRPFGTKYNLTMGHWLQRYGLDGISNQERYRALLCLDNIEAIQKWRDGLDDNQRHRLNHPGAIWAHWRRSIARPSTLSSRPMNKSRNAGYGRPVNWSSDALRRAATAIREARSTDTIILAKAALQAAVRNEYDLVQMLSHPPKKPALYLSFSQSAPVTK